MLGILHHRVDVRRFGNRLARFGHRFDVAFERLAAHGQRFVERAAGGDASGKIRKRDAEIARRFLVDQADVVPHGLTCSIECPLAVRCLVVCLSAVPFPDAEPSPNQACSDADSGDGFRVPGSAASHPPRSLGSRRGCSCVYHTHELQGEFWHGGLIPLDIPSKVWNKTGTPASRLRRQSKGGRSYRDKLGHCKLMAMLKIETEREADGRWIGEVPALPGVLAYGQSEAEARTRATALALRVIADRIEHGEKLPAEARDLFAPA